MSGYFYVYIMTNQNNTVLYTGMTNNLIRRVWEHKDGASDSFTARYSLNKLAWYEVHEDPESAILREKGIKAGSRRAKEELIKGMNREWRDLSEEL